MNHPPSHSAMRVLFAGGGTGGHLMPGAATAEALRELLPDARALFMVTCHKAERLFLPAVAAFETVQVPATPWDGAAEKLRFPLRAARAAGRVASILRGFRPHVIVGLGCSSCVVPVLVGRALGFKAVLFEANAVPGRAVRALAPLAECVVAQWETAAAGALKARRVVAAGNPVRARLFEPGRRAARRRLGLWPDRVTMLVTGGSQGARALNRALYGALERIARQGPKLQVIHLTGLDHMAEAQCYAERASVTYRPIGFLERVEEAYVAADFALSRAGGSTLAYLTAAGVPSILVPYPAAADNHQRANADVLCEAGAAVAIPQNELTEERLAEAIRTLAVGAALRAQMAGRARRIGRPESARAVARTLGEIAGFGPAMDRYARELEKISKRTALAA